MKLMCELMEDVEMLVEKDESTDQKNYYNKGVFLQATTSQATIDESRGFFRVVEAEKTYPKKG